MSVRSDEFAYEIAGPLMRIAGPLRSSAGSGGIDQVSKVLRGEGI